MKQEIIVTNYSETIKKTEALLLDNLRNNRNDFLEIIRYPEYQFNTGLSFRMLNYYENESMLKAKRNSKKGKRRISFLDLHALKFLIANRQKTSKLERLDFNNLIEVVIPELSDGNIAPSTLETYLMVALVCLGIKDVYLETKYTELFPNYSPYNLSEVIRLSISNLDLTLYRNQEFITNVIYEVDRLRLSLGLKVLSNENLQEIGKAPFNTQVHRNRALQAVPIFLKSPLINEFKNHSYIYRNDDGMVYGMEIKFLGNEDFLAPEDRTQFSLSINEIIKKTK
jgi:hypothetical protein